MGHEDREKKFEQALARHLRRDDAGARHEADANADVRDEIEATVACPDAATLAAFHEGMLSSTEMDAAKEHVASCLQCQHVLLQLKATDEIPLEVEAENVLAMRELVLPTGVSDVHHAARHTPGMSMTAPASAMKTPKDISRRRGFKTLRWAAPAGAIAAGLLIWFVARDHKQTLSHFENVQVAQDQPSNERLAAPRPLPASPAPEAVTKSKQLNELRKDGSRVKQPAEESGALRAPKSSPAAIANEVGAVASQASPRANAPQRPANSRDYSSLEATENKPPEISARQADVSVTAVAPVESAPAASVKTRGAAGEPRAQSAASMATPPAAPNGASSNAAKQKSDANHTDSVTTMVDEQAALTTEQIASTDKLQSRSLVLIGKAVDAKKILAPGGTMLWRVGAAGRIEQSVDSGVTWVPQNSGVKVELLAGSAPSEAVCWIVGRSGTILRTTDGGGHWNKVFSPMGGDVAGVRAVDAMTAEIFDANRSARFVTHDGGVTWEAAKE